MRLVAVGMILKHMGSEQSTPDPLTSREVAVARLAADGLSCEEIGERLYLTANTVKTHLQHAYRKLGVRNRAQLTRILLEGPEITPTGDRQ